MLVQTKLEVCVGVRSGPKGPVIDLSIFGLESLSKQNLRFALGYILGRGALSLIFLSVEGSRSTWKYVQALDGLEAPRLVQTNFHPGRAGQGQGQGQGQGRARARARARTLGGGGLGRSLERPCKCQWRSRQFRV